MPNGYDRNWIRLCAAIDGFRSRYNRWPTRIRLFPGILSNLQERVFTPKTFQKIEERIQFVPDEAPIVAEDDQGAQYSYGDEGFSRTEPDVDARTWLGVSPDRPDPGWDA